MKPPSFLFSHPLMALGTCRGMSTPMFSRQSSIFARPSALRRHFQKRSVDGRVPCYIGLNDLHKYGMHEASSSIKVGRFSSKQQFGQRKLNTAFSNQSESKDETAPHGLEMEIVDPATNSVIDDWRNDWYCYWDDSYGMPSDLETNYVFKPPLEMSRCGVVRSRGDNWEEGSYDTAIADSVLTINNLFKEAKDEGDGYGVTIGHGDESDNEWLPIAIRWADADGDLTPEGFLKKIGAHSQLIDSVFTCKFPENEDEDYYDNDESFERHKMKPYFSNKDSFSYFYCGDEKLNPVPFFAVAKVCPGLVAGFVGGVIYT